MAKLEARDVEISYPSRNADGMFTAVSGVSFDIEAGEFVAIVGPSGCGKTTFLSAVDGLVPVSGGAIRLDGHVVDRPGPDRAMVFQAPALLPWRTVAGNIAYGLELNGRKRHPETRATVDRLVEMVGLGKFRDSYPAELSGGMQQRVNLARALAVDPELILLDEPFAALDAQTREDMQAELLRIWAAAQKTALFITHQIDEAVYLADRVLVFSSNPGTVIADIRIEIPRPRDLEVKRSAEFTAYVNQIWDLLKAAKAPGHDMGVAVDGADADGIPEGREAIRG